jgi:hypothetical protein
MGPLVASKFQKSVATPDFKKSAKAVRSRYYFGASRIGCEAGRRMSAFGGKADMPWTSQNVR